MNNLQRRERPERLFCQSWGRILGFGVWALALALSSDCTRFGFGGEIESCQRWNSKKKVSITGVAQPLADYQVRVLVEREPGMQADFRDLRFRDRAGGALDFWLESQSPRNATVWVKVPAIPPEGTELEMFYDSLCPISGSDYAAAFPWTTEVVDPTVDVQHTSIVLDGSDYPHISYRHIAEGRLRYARWNGASWSIETVDDTTDNGRHGSLVLDGSGVPHISYFDNSDFSVRYTTRDGGSWKIQIVDGGTEDYGAYTSLALNSASRPTIAYRRGGTRELKLASWDGQFWGIDLVDPICTGVTALKLDDDEVPHIAYSACDLGLFHAAKREEGWEKTKLDENSDYVGLGLDSRGNPGIAYYDWQIGLKYAFYNGSSWEIEEARIANRSGSFLGLVLDKSDTPHVSYQDLREERVLGYARRGEGSWTVELVDVAPEAGGDSAIALDSYGFPHISYNVRNVGLKHAYRRRQISPAPEAFVGAPTSE